MNRLNKLKVVGFVGATVCGGCLSRMILKRRQLHALDTGTDTGQTSDGDNNFSPNTSPQDLELKQVQIFFRHGARTVLRVNEQIDQVTYSRDDLLRDLPMTMFDYQVTSKDGGEAPHSVYNEFYDKTILKGGCNGGMLTTYGQYQVYELGRRLRAEYINKKKFIDRYDPELVYIRSTNMKRTVHSLRCVMAGFFGAQELQEQGIVKVPVFKSKEEHLFPNPYICPVLRHINHSSVIHGVDLPEIVPDRLQLEAALGINIEAGDKKLNFIDIRDNFIVRLTHGLPIPDVARPMMKTIEQNAVKLMYYAQCGQHEAERMVAMRLSSGRLMNIVMDNIDKAAAGISKPKMFLFSAHDTTLMALLGVLDRHDGKWPPFASDLRFELYEDSSKEKYIHVMYNGKPQIVRGCDKELCPLRQFQDAIKPYQIDEKEYTEVCHSNILEKIAKEILEQEVGEVEDEETKQRSNIAAGL